MATGTIPAPQAARTLEVAIPAGKTLTITPGNNTNNIAALVMGFGAGAEAAGLYFISGFGSNNISYKELVTLNAASIITATKLETGWTFQNTSENHGFALGITLFETQPGRATLTVA